MNTAQLKTYAPKARLKFIEAIKTKLKSLGIEKNKVAQVERSGDFIFIHKQPFAKSIESARNQIIKNIERYDFEHVVEQYAYTWFNRLCALRFMELHDGYLTHGYRVLSHSQREQGFDFIDQAVDVAEYFGLETKSIIDLKLEHQDEQLYRQLLLAQCNQLHEAMPFLFDPIDSVTSLLLPDDLTRNDSIIADMVQQVDEESWQQVEIIGWLYQFYISDLKDEVIGKTVATEDIPYATQLFTPNWIVKYMVQNSLGRYWLQTYPDTIITLEGTEHRLKDLLQYYIEPAEQEDSVKTQLAKITPSRIEPTSIKVIDPASGSGHILVEAYDLLKLIYVSQGYRERDIAKLILENNIFGLDIDDRAEQLTGFALMMKARQDDRRIFERGLHLNICAFQNSDELDARQLWQNLNLNQAWQAGSHADMFGHEVNDLGNTDNDSRFKLITDLIEKFQNAKAFGSLIAVDNSQETELFELKNTLQDLMANGDSLQKTSTKKLFPVVEQAWILSQRYDAVIANPPYMGGKGMNVELKSFAKTNFPNSKSDLFAIMIERCLDLATSHGLLGMVTPYVWMFISSYQELREKIVNQHTLASLIQLEYNAFEPACIPVATYILNKSHIQSYIGSYIKLSEFKGHQNQAPKTLEAIKNPNCGWFYISKPDDFKKIPSSPIAYWVSDNIFRIFKNGKKFSNYAGAKQGLATADNSRFLRIWSEVSLKKIGFKIKNHEVSGSSFKWYPHSKGGGFKRWYGNNDWIINWSGNGVELKKFEKAVLRNTQDYFKQGVTWCDLTSSYFNARRVEDGFIFDTTGPTAIPKNEKYLSYLHNFMNSKVFQVLVNVSLQGLHYSNGVIADVPVLEEIFNYSQLVEIERKLFELNKLDYSFNENTWDFKQLPLLNLENKKQNLSESYQATRTTWQNMTDEVQRLEVENNDIFIKAYGLEDELTPDVPLNEITLTCNPRYRYKGEVTDEQLEQRLQSDSIAELISYAIGCMMGRYSLDREGLVYAHEGNVGFTELVAEGAYQTFPADEDGILPILDEERFPDDVYQRLEKFVETVWSAETLQQNLDFIAESLRLNLKFTNRNGESHAQTIRRYLANHFFKDHHLKGYKNRPIYWLFSSGKQKAFECLVYMHRFNDSTLAKMRTQYVLPLLGQYTSRLEFVIDSLKDESVPQSEKTKYHKEQDSLVKKLDELKDFDAELKHHIEQKITIDLDDGVKVNYAKFEKLLAESKKVTGK